MWHDTKEIASEPRTVLRCFSLYYLDHSHNPSNITSCDLCAPASSVQVGCPIAACAFAKYMINTAD